MTYWILKCKECGRSWKLYVSYNLKKEFSSFYHYCPYCKRNTFHEIMEFIEE